MNKKRVGIIFGGQSAEHEVSLQSAKNIIDAIDKDKFDVVLIGIDKKGEWHLNNATGFLTNEENPSLIALNRTGKNIALVPGQASEQLIRKQSAEQILQVDIIFPIVHGTLGEDGALQGLLRMSQLPFVGSDVLGSAVSMDKDFAKRLLRDSGLNVAPWISVSRAKRGNIDLVKTINQLGLPLFIKPANQGSSVGVSKVYRIEDMEAAIDTAFTYDKKILIESCITGREIECAVLGNDEPTASPCGEVVVNDEFYSYTAKYIDEKGASIKIPAEISYESSEEIRGVAVKAFEALGCSGMARVDVFLMENGNVIVNEVNTLPGFTNISMYPKLWQEGGIFYRDLITKLLDLAQERHQQSLYLKTSI